MPDAQNMDEQRRQQRETDNQSVPLLKLPGELRNRIYDFILPEGEIINIETGGFKEHVEHETESDYLITSTKHARPWLRAHIGISRTSRQTRNDTVKRIYTSNTFLVQGSTHRAPRVLGAARRWLRSRPHEVRNTSVSFVLQQFWSISNDQRKIALLDIGAKTVRYWSPQHCRVKIVHRYQDCFEVESSVDDQLITVIRRFFF